MARIGVFICHCGENIARTLRVKELAERARWIPGVVHSEDYVYMCSEPGQKKVRDAIVEKKLTGVVVAACSPQLHEETFRKACAKVGLNPFLCEMANIREQCSWVHTDKDKATEKAYQHLRFIIEKIRKNRPLTPVTVPITARVLIIGGGIAGIQAALDIADSGIPVTIVEKEPSIGGNMARLSETFPTLDCAQCILTPKMVSVSHHPNIELLTYSEVEEVRGYVGNFEVTIKRKARYVDEDVCTGCGDCVPVCPVAVPNKFDRNLSWRKAIHIPFPQAVPPVYTLDDQNCLNGPNMFPLACERCFHACAPQAINYTDRPKRITKKFGAIIVATGYELIDPYYVRELGYGLSPDVLDGLEFERLLSASGPTGGEVVRPSDHRVPKTVVFIQCAGSRNPANGLPYCSRICCMATAKHALLYRHKVPDGTAYIFYMDIRAAGKGYEEFIKRVMEEERILYIRGAVARVYSLDGKLLVEGVDTLSGRKVEVLADLVVLATAVVGANNKDLVQKLRLAVDEYGFAQEAHPKLRPVETLNAGVFLAGAAQGPKDIPDTVAQASAAASKALSLIGQKVLEREPTIASVNEVTCAGCFECERVCPYGAIERKEIRDRSGNLVKVVSRVNSGICNGCGACVVACRNKSMDLAGFSEEQIFASLSAVA